MLIANYNPRIYQGIARNDAGAEVRIVLQPGLNEVDADAFALVSQQPGPARRIDDGEFGEIKATSKLDPRSAMGLAKLTGNLEILRRWHAAEKREQVRAALEAQIDEIETHERSRNA